MSDTWKRFYTVFYDVQHKYPNKIKIHSDSLRAFRFKVRELTRRNSGKSLEQVIANLNPYLRGWAGYFSTSESVYPMRNLDAWIRRRLRSYQWKAWKTYRMRKKMLLKMGVRYGLAQSTAFTSKSYWRLSQSPGVVIAMSNKYFDSIGLYRLTSKY